MKKILIALTVALSLVGINSVKADDLQLELYGYDSFVDFKSFFGEEEFNNIINEMIEEYKVNYYTYYPYFDIILSNYDNFKGITLNYYMEIPSSFWSWTLSQGMGWTAIDLIKPRSSNYLQRSYYLEDDVLKYEDDNTPTHAVIISTRDGRNVPSYDTEGAWYRYTPYNYYYSNYDLILDPIAQYENKYDSTFNAYGTAYLYNYDNFLIPKLNDPTINSVVSYDREDFLIEPYYLYDEDSDLVLPQYTEINLNDYAYVALALKDYQQEPFETNVQVKGQFCPTAVYNRGLTARDEILGSVTDRCNIAYDNFTPMRLYVTESDISNKAIYYIKSYDTSIDNIIKVDTSIFDISYITEEDKDNPIITVEGKKISSIPYDELPSTATNNETNNFVPGASKEFSFSDIFTAPLEFLKDVWDAISSVFGLITELLSLLPPVMQNFLYASFMLAIIIGLIKIIL